MVLVNNILFSSMVCFGHESTGVRCVEFALYVYDNVHELGLSCSQAASVMSLRAARLLSLVCSLYFRPRSSSASQLNFYHSRFLGRIFSLFLDKEAISYNKIFDAFRVGLICYG